MFKIQNVGKAVLDYKFFLFPGGEVGIKLIFPPNYNTFFKPGSHEYFVTANVHNSNDIMSLAMIKNALEIEDPDAIVNLFLPYVPYARQDRVCDNGEAFSLKVFTDLLNSLSFNKVTICDPHSDVTPALIDNVKVITQLDIIKKFGAFHNMVMGNSNCIFVSPDAGSNKKVSKAAGYFKHQEFIRADKLRDLSTGNIKETIVYCDDLKGADVIVLDDICDGGGTFIKLAEVLKTKNCGKIILFVTHCIASKGFEALYNGGIDEVWTTDSFQLGFMGYLPSSPKLNIFKLEDL